MYKPNILQVKLTSDSRTKKSKRRAALQKQRDAIKKAKLKKQQAAKKKRGQAKTKRKISKVPHKEPRVSMLIQSQSGGVSYEAHFPCIVTKHCTH